MKLTEKREGNSIKIIGMRTYASPEMAKERYEKIIELLNESGMNIERNSSRVNGEDIGLTIRGIISNEELYEKFKQSLESLWFLFLKVYKCLN